MTIRIPDHRVATRTLEHHSQLIGESVRSLKALEGSRVRILSNFNGQPHGGSKKSLKGTIHTIREVMVSFGGEVVFFLDRYDLSIGSDEVTFDLEEVVQ